MKKLNIKVGISDFAEIREWMLLYRQNRFDQ